MVSSVGLTSNWYFMVLSWFANFFLEVGVGKAKPCNVIVMGYSLAPGAFVEKVLATALLVQKLRLAADPVKLGC